MLFGRIGGKTEPKGLFGGPRIIGSPTMKRQIWLAMGISFVTNILVLVQPVFMLHVYDFVLPSQSVPTLIYLSLIAIFLLIVLGALDQSRQRVFTDLAWELDGTLRPTCFRAAYLLGRRNPRAGRSAFTSDLDAVKQFVGSTAPGALMDLPWTVILIGALCFLSPWLGLLTAMMGAMVSLAAWMNELGMRTHLSEAARRNARATRLAEDMFQATDAVEAMKFSKHAIARWTVEASAQAAYARAAGASGAVWMSVVKTLRLMVQVVTLAAAAYLVLLGKLTPGAMIAASIIGARALAPLDQVVGSWRLLILGRDAWARLGQLTADVDPVNETSTVPPAMEGLLEAESVTLMGEGDKPIIHNVRLRLPKGGFLGLVGASGSGKTTFARVLSGAIPPDNGVVKIDGLELSNWPDAQLGPSVGYLPQNVQLLGGTVAENIRRFGARDDEAVTIAAQRAGAHAMISSLPEGYETDVGDGGGRLSGGQRALIGLSRALYGDPKIIILDEPAASLDAEGRASLNITLQALKAEGKTLVMVSHDLASLRNFDVIAEMRQGQIARHGPPSEMLGPVKMTTPPPGAPPASSAGGPLVSVVGARPTAQPATGAAFTTSRVMVAPTQPARDKDA
jgi:PrtD family type I secretion system ABC transporter